MLAVSFEPHVGRHLISGADVDLKQDLIYVNGQHVGYVGRQPGAPVNLIVPDPSAELRRSVLAAVADRFGEIDLQPRRVAAPVDVEAEIEDGGWDEEEE